MNGGDEKVTAGRGRDGYLVSENLGRERGEEPRLRGSSRTIYRKNDWREISR